MVDQVARDEIGKVSARLDIHIASTDLRMEEVIGAKFTHMGESFADLKKAVVWGAGIIFTAMMSVLAWSIVQQINANEAQKAELARQIDLLQQNVYAIPVEPNPDAPRSVEVNASTSTGSQ